MRDQDLARKEDVSPTMRELATVLFRQRKLFIGVAGLVLVLAVAYAFAGATYRAHVRVLVRRGVVANDLTAHDWLRWLRFHEDQAARVERAAKKLANRLDVEPIKKTNLIAVSYDAADPQLAEHVLQSLASVYLEKHMEVHRPGGQLHFFDEQTGESRRQLEEAEGKLMDFTKSHDVVVAAQQRDLVLQRLNDVEASYREIQVEMSGTKHRVHELDAQLTKLPTRSITQVRTADNPELLRDRKSVV